MRLSPRRCDRRPAWFGLSVIAVGVLVALAPAAVLARSSAPPVNVSPPVIENYCFALCAHDLDEYREGGKALIVAPGTWHNNPTSGTSQWQRCSIDGASCVDFDIATGPGQAACSGYGPGQCYVPVRDDVGHALRVEVTAVNEEGSATASSQASIPISSHDGPRYQYGATGWPQIVGSWKVGGMGRKGGSGRVGEKLWAGTGLWRNPTSLTSARVQWQRCAADPNARHFDPGRDCRNIAGAVTTCGRACLRYSAGVPFFGRGHSVQELKIHGVPSYRVRAADVGHRLRLLLTVLGPNGGTGYSVSLPSTLVR